jgi:histidine triad (HIT) family protein
LARISAVRLSTLHSQLFTLHWALRLAILRTMESCVFCRVADGTVPARILFEDDEIVAFHDIAPRAPVHVLVIPRRHIVSLASVGVDDRGVLATLFAASAAAARRTGIAETGYRVVTNVGAGAGQSVFHLHLHVLGGRPMGWPPG